MNYLHRVRMRMYQLGAQDGDQLDELFGEAGRAMTRLTDELHDLSIRRAAGRGSRGQPTTIGESPRQGQRRERRTTPRSRGTPHLLTPLLHVHRRKPSVAEHSGHRPRRG
jgi:hypothetical protein